MSASFPTTPFTLRYPYLSFLFPPILLPPVPTSYFSPNVTNQFNINSLLSTVDETRSPVKSVVTMKCPHCLQVFENAPLLELHLLSHRPILQMPTTSTKSPKFFKPTVTLKSSSTTPVSSSKFPINCRCQVCGKVFSRHWLLQGHIRTHTGEKPFKCHICSKAFADKSNLRAHIQTHSGVKPFSCNRCGKRFALKSYLSKHEESTCMRSAIKSRQMTIL